VIKYFYNICFQYRKSTLSYREHVYQFLDGEESLISQGCPDLALLAVTAKNRTENFPLAFVHIVKDDDDTEHHCDKGLEVDNSDTEEDNNDEEFEMEDDDGIDSHKEDSEGQVTSDEEYEFE